MPASMRFLCAIILAGLMLPMGGCPQSAPPPAAGGGQGSSSASLIQAASLNDPQRAVPLEGPISLRAARNEVVQFVVQVNRLPEADGKKGPSLRVTMPRLVGGGQSLPQENLAAFQVLNMPIDVNRAGFVRHTGLAASTTRLPRALLPVEMVNGHVVLNRLRNPDAPTDPKQYVQAGQSTLIWIDLAVPPRAAAGDYEGAVELLINDKPAVRLGLKLSVYDFVVPDERHLIMNSSLEWESLVRLYPEQFEAVTPWLLSRKDPKYAAAVATLDSLVKLAQANRVQVTIPRLQPIVKWPAGQPPVVSWEGYDTLVGPWLQGDAFADHVPVSFWPVPNIDFLDRYDKASQSAYWAAAGVHFDQLDWLARSAAVMDKRTVGRARGEEALQISADAAVILNSYPRIRVSAPLEEGQVMLASESNPGLVDSKTLDRLMLTAPGLVSAQPVRAGSPRMGPKWLRTDLSGLIPYIGAGADEREARLWSWLAFLRNAQLIEWSSPLPRQSTPQALADPDELVWFYPGSWFGVDQPLPTVQLKWLRRAQQDYEYLYLARQRGQVTHALVMARLITKPVEILPTQEADPVYALMCGTADEEVWTQALGLLAKTILLRQPGQPAERSAEIDLNARTMEWIAPQERPILLGRQAQWSLLPDGRGNAKVASLKLMIDVYNAADQRPESNKLQWTGVPEGWQIAPQPVEVPELYTYNVRSFPIEAKVQLDRITERSRKPLDITFTNGYTQRGTLLRVMLPVANSDRREGSAPRLDGSLEDWQSADSIHEGKLIRMCNRPSIQRQELPFATTASGLYSNWTPTHFYVAFRLTGLDSGPPAVGRSFTDYQFRRAWGEDLAEVLIQPVYADNSVGPLVHAVCKPAGQVALERRLDPKLNAQPYAPVEGADVRFATTTREDVWRGELGIPWSAMTDPKHEGQQPVLLRFNFVQHHNATGESDSWAGPVDFGRDDRFMGLLILRTPPAPGMGEMPQ